MSGAEQLEALLDDPKPARRAQALFDLLDDDDAQQQALALFPFVADEVADDELAEGLLERLLDRSRCPRGRQQLAATFSALEADRGRAGALLDELAHGSDDERAMAAVALGSRGNDAAVPALVRALTDECLPVRLAAVEALADIGCEEATDRLLTLLEGEHEPRVRCAALAGLRGRVGPRVEATLQLHLEHAHVEVRLTALTSLRDAPSLAETLPVRKLLHDADARVRALSLAVLERHGGDEDAGAAKGMLADPDPRVRGMARDAFATLGGPLL